MTLILMFLMMLTTAALVGMFAALSRDTTRIVRALHDMLSAIEVLERRANINEGLAFDEIRVVLRGDGKAVIEMLDDGGEVFAEVVDVPAATHGLTAISVPNITGRVKV